MKVPIIFQMATCTTESGNKMQLMAWECLDGQTGLSMMESGRTTNFMVEEPTHGMMGGSI